MGVVVIARILLAGLVLTVGSAFAFQGGAAHATETGATWEPVTEASPTGIDFDVDGDEDDDRVEVQLLVLGTVIVTVFILGTGAYLLRRKLGLTAYTPPADSGHH